VSRDGWIRKKPWYELAQPVRRFHGDKTQDSKRRHFSPHEKVAAVKRHLLERVPISAICEELKIAPNMFYRWQQALFENAHLSFETDRKSKATEATKDRRIAAGSQIAGSQNQPSLERLGYDR
jgi:transposase-like protein